MKPQQGQEPIQGENMKLQSRKFTVGLFAVGAMLFAACGGSDSATEAVSEDTTAAAAEATSAAVAAVGGNGGEGSCI